MIDIQPNDINSSLWAFGSGELKNKIYFDLSILYCSDIALTRSWLATTFGTFAKSLDQDQDQQNVGRNLDPKVWFLKGLI